MIRKVVYIVDDDALVVRGLARVLRLLRYAVTAYDSADAFLAEVSGEAPACVLLDAFMQPTSGLDVLGELKRKGIDIPVVFISGHADVASCARAMKRGAVDYLLKPLSMRELELAIAEAHSISAARRRARFQAERAQALLARLTLREREVLSLVLAGRRNKEIASALASQEATVKVHRSRLMHKLQVKSIPELVQLASFGGSDNAAATNVVALEPPPGRDGDVAGRRRGLPRAAADRSRGHNPWTAATGTWTAFTWPRP